MRILNEERPHFSISQLTSYLQCPLRYYFEYVQGLPWPSVPSAVVFGAAIHSAIEAINLSLMNGGPISLDEAASEFTRAWTEKVESGGINWKTASECAELLTIGNDMVTLYHQKFSVSKFRAVEMEFRVPALSPDGFLIESHDLVGKIDAVSQGGAIIEVKTASKKPSQLECDMNMQLTAYSLSYRYLFGMPEEKIVLVSLIKTKEAQMEIIKTTRNEKRYIKLLHLMDLVLKCINACMFYPNPLNVWGCRGCPYVGDCESKWPL